MFYQLGGDSWCIDDRKQATVVLCPKCGGEHLELGRTLRDSFSKPAFQDEIGRWHRHDENMVTQYFICRECEHEFTRSVPPEPCWCGWSA